MLMKELTKYVIGCLEVEVLAIPDEDFDYNLWDDEDGFLAGLIARGEKTPFRAECVIRQDGAVIGTATMPDLLYDDPENFVDHIRVGRVNRQRREQGDAGRCQSVVRQLVHQAIAAARFNMSPHAFPVAS